MTRQAYGPCPACGAPAEQSTDPLDESRSVCYCGHPRFYDYKHADGSCPCLVENRNRTTNPYGKSPEDRRRVRDDLDHVEPLLRRVASHGVRTTAPLPEVVTAILRLVDAGN